MYHLFFFVCLSYSYYKDKKQTEADLIFENILNILLSQYRVSSTHKLTDYTIPFRFLSHTKAYYSSHEIDDFIAKLNIKLDDIEDLLTSFYEICTVLKDQQKK